MIVIDTDVLIEILNKRSKKGDEALEKIVESGEGISTTTLTLHEILYGLQKYAKPVKEVLQLPVLSYTKKDASLSSAIELRAEKRGAPTRRTDAMIAAIAINNAASIYTFDVGHFEPLAPLGLKMFT